MASSRARDHSGRRSRMSMACLRTWGVNWPQCATSTDPRSGTAAWPAASSRPAESAGVALALTTGEHLVERSAVGVHLRQPVRGGDPFARPGRFSSTTWSARAFRSVAMPTANRSPRPQRSARVASASCPFGLRRGIRATRSAWVGSSSFGGVLLDLGPAGCQAGEERLGGAVVGILQLAQKLGERRRPSRPERRARRRSGRPTSWRR